MLLTPSFAFGSFSDMNGPNSYLSIVCGTSNSKGAWLEAVASTPFEVQLISIEYSTTAPGAIARSVLMDVGVGAGASEVVLIPDLSVSNAGSFASFRQHSFTFPVRIPAGSRIALRGQNDQATAGALNARVAVFGGLSAPESLWSGSGVEAIGTINGSSGVTFTPIGNSGAYTNNIGTNAGDWHSLGVTTRPCRWFQFAHGCHNANMSGAQYLDVEFGFGDGSTVTTVYRQRSQSSGLEELCVMRANSHPMPFFAPPVGTTVYVRSRSNNTPIDPGYHAMAYGAY